MKLKSFLNQFFIIFLLLILISCEENGAKQPRIYVNDTVTENSLMGHWFCQDFIDMVSMRRSVRLVNTRPMFIEMVFKPEYKDSVLLITGYENLFVHYETIGRDSIAIKGLLPGTMLLIVPMTESNTLLVTDSAIGKRTENPQAWSFFKAPDDLVSENSPGNSRIYHAINKALIAGDYKIADDAKSKISFRDDGTVSGWANYTNYTICKGGDCFRNTPAPFDILEAKGSTGTDLYGCIMGDSLLVYPLLKQNTNKGMGYKQTGTPLVFRR